MLDTIDSLARRTSGKLNADLVALLGQDRLLHRASDLVRYASDVNDELSTWATEDGWVGDD